MTDAATEIWLNILVWTIAGLTVVIPAMTIIHAWLVDKTLETAPAILTVVVLLGMISAVWHYRGNSLRFVFLAVLVVTSLVIPAIYERLNRRGIQQMKDDDISLCQARVERQPRNPLAHAALGDAFMAAKRYVEAVAAYEQSVALDPDHSDTEREKLKRAIASKEGAERRPIVMCGSCEYENTVDDKYCVRCGAPLQLGCLEWLIRPENLLGILGQVLPVLVVLLVLVIVLSAASTVVKTCVVGGVLVLGGFFFLRKIGGD